MGYLRKFFLSIREMEPIKIDSGALKNFSQSAFRTVGVCSTHAEIAAEALLKADLRGVFSHGNALLPLYIKRIQNGEISSKAKIKLRKNKEAIALLDGQNGLGHVVAGKAMQCAIKKANQYGVSAVGVMGSHHFGMAAHYAMMAISHDMIGLVCTVSNINTMAPWGGMDILLGNNPIAVAIPALTVFPVVYDGAFSVAARRKIHLAAAEGKEIPEGWAVDKAGIPTTDAKKALEGILLPIGGYKGYGMAFVTSLLAGVLTGAAFGGAIENKNVGHFFCVLDIKFFGNPLSFKSLVDQAVKEMKKSRRIDSGKEILVPGERGYRNEMKYLKEGIPLLETTIVALNKMGEELGIKLRIAP